MGALLILLAFAACLALLGVIVRGDHESQVEELFAGLKHGMETATVGDVLACVDEGYPYFEIWPELEALADAPPKPADRAAAGREAARRALQQTFMTQMLNREVTRTMTYEVHGVTPRKDGTFAADVTIEVEVTGSRIGRVPSVRTTFILRRTGWLFPAMRILKHDRFTYGR